MALKFERGTTNRARNIALKWVEENLPEYSNLITTGLPEYDDRTDLWRVPLNTKNSKLVLIGEVCITRNVDRITDTTQKDIIVERVKAHKNPEKSETASKDKTRLFYPAPVPNKVILGNSIDVLDEFPPDTAQLVFTSPPYYNAKPEYSEYVDYQEYLDFLRRIFLRCTSILSEGRFFVVNISPVLIKRISRSTSSKRMAIPFDIHRILESIGLEFVDDIFWVKPEGAGWNIGRGRRFAADRQPLQYKPVPVTEYILVYRKKTDKLIDWNIRNHYDQNLVKDSKILGEYDRTNIWHIHPSFNKFHPATFPEELVEKVIRYYSFIDDLVLDPFAGSGTVGKVALKMGRRFLLVDREVKYFKLMKDSISKVNTSNIRVDFNIDEEFTDLIKDGI
ncbi:DNA-methyltransferase [Dyadobacter crusticola]|uniref:DNA-methyltransferase n=1 Tax=Dyadobacter crusticola TaxID=292407 RepID=UPI0004E185CE|nr:site-specific DNA-methyltransferase [Dyadobacter crusticola]